MKTCKNCGETTDNFHSDPRNKDGLTANCATCENTRSYERRRDNPAKMQLSVYKCRAKRKGLDFDLTLENFETLRHAYCEYCGDNDTLGFDRIDSSTGYVRENVTACCKTCNTMKNSLSYGEFMAHIAKINNFSLGGI